MKKFVRPLSAGSLRGQSGEESTEASSLDGVRLESHGSAGQLYTAELGGGGSLGGRGRRNVADTWRRGDGSRRDPGELRGEGEPRGVSRPCTGEYLGRVL